MKVKFLQGISGPDFGSFAPGDVGNIDDDEAKRLIKAGIAEKVVAQSRTASRDPGEKATKERGGKRK